MSDLTPDERLAALQNDPAYRGAEVLRRMADKLALNASNGFGGAFVLIPPNGEIKELLMLNNSQDLAVFWSLVQTAATIAVNELKDKEQNAWGRR
jgi:hypothetical protein